ncbi:MAG: hypothetical protein WEB88_16385 [Gemmatimonadota bacterium]
MSTRIFRTAGLVVLTLGAATAIGALIVRDQVVRHRRDLFSRRRLQRFAALGYIAGLGASVESVHLLRDFVAWEPTTLLRRKAEQILGRMEHQLEGPRAMRSELAG